MIFDWTDAQVTVEVDHDIAELGGAFRCSVKRAPVDGVANTGNVGQIRAVRMSLFMYTEGRGDKNSRRYAETEVPVDEHGMASADVLLHVPADAPISYDGQLIRVRWELEARTDVKFLVDKKWAAPVLVVPVGGLGRYDRPHPVHLT